MHRGRGFRCLTKHPKAGAEDGCLKGQAVAVLLSTSSMNRPTDHGQGGVLHAWRAGFGSQRTYYAMACCQTRTKAVKAIWTGAQLPERATSVKHANIHVIHFVNKVCFLIAIVANGSQQPRQTTAKICVVGRAL